MSVTFLTNEDKEEVVQTITGIQEEFEQVVVDMQVQIDKIKNETDEPEAPATWEDVLFAEVMEDTLCRSDGVIKAYNYNYTAYKVNIESGYSYRVTGSVGNCPTTVSLVTFYKEGEPSAATKVGSYGDIVSSDIIKYNQEIIPVENYPDAVYMIINNEDGTATSFKVEKVNGDPPAEEDKGLKFLIFGDSITQTDDYRPNFDGVLAGRFNRTNNWWKFIAQDFGADYSLGTEDDTSWNFAVDGGGFIDKTGLNNMQRFSYQIYMALQKFTTDNPPDVIVIALGTNNKGDAIGDFNEVMALDKDTLLNYTGASVDGSPLTNVYTALRWGLLKLKTTFPHTPIFISTPLQTAGKMIDITTGKFNPNAMDDVRNAIIKMAEMYNAHLIDVFAESGITYEFEVATVVNGKVEGSMGRYLYDGLHPTPKKAIEGQTPTPFNENLGVYQLAKLYTRRIKEVLGLTVTNARENGYVDIPMI